MNLLQRGAKVGFDAVGMGVSGLGRGENFTAINTCKRLVWRGAKFQLPGKCGGEEFCPSSKQGLETTCALTVWPGFVIFGSLAA